MLLPPANEVWGKVIFSVACVKNSVHRGVCLSACWDTTTPRSRDPLPGADTPRAETPWSRHPPPLTRYPLGTRNPPRTRHPPRLGTPLHSACWEIRSTNGRYAIFFGNEANTCAKYRISVVWIVSLWQINVYVKCH